jgi:hypothetical protein
VELASGCVRSQSTSRYRSGLKSSYTARPAAKKTVWAGRAAEASKEKTR